MGEDQGDGCDEVGGEKNGFGHSGVDGKFFTFTGDRLGNCPSQINQAPLIRSRILSVVGSRQDTVSPEQWDGPLHDVDEGAIPLRINDLKCRDDLFARRWGGDKIGLDDQSRSGLDFAVIGALARNGFSFSETVYALCNIYEQPSAAVEDWQSGNERQMRRAYGRCVPEPKPSAVEEFGFVSERPANAQHDPVMKSVKERAAVPLMFTFWQQRDLKLIPKLRTLYGGFYASGYTSVTVAPPKVGKSALVLAEAIDMATGRGILTGKPQAPLKVVYLNLEDDQDALDSRVAALLTHYDIPQSEIVNGLCAQSGVGSGFHLMRGNDAEINEAAFAGLADFVADQKPDVMIFDPLQDLLQCPETNEAFRRLAGRLRQFTSAQGIAAGLVHHTRKMQNGSETTMDDMRGGSALRGFSRFNRILAPMGDTEAIKLGVEDHSKNLFRIAGSESNFTPPTSKRNKWFKRHSIITPAGANEVAIDIWTAPDMGADDTPENAAKVRSAIQLRTDKPRDHSNAANWVGHIIAECVGLSVDDGHHKAKIKHLQRAWIAAGYLSKYHDKENGKSVPFVKAGPVDPLDGAN